MQVRLNTMWYNDSMFRICSKLRLYPTKSQETHLRQTLSVCCDVYNSLLGWREFAWDTEQKSVSRYEQQAALPIWKKAIDANGDLLHPELKGVYSQVLQDIVHRVDLAYSAFFDRLQDYNERKAQGRLKEGEGAPGKPRKKGRGHYDSLSYTQLGFTLNENSVTLAKIGTIKAVVHRQIDDKLKTCIIRRYGSKWFACLAYEVDAELLAESTKEIGIDVGIEKFAALSNGEFIDNPRFFRTDQKALAKAQRKFDKAKNKHRSQARRKAKKTVSRINERIRNRRHNFHHQNARKLVNEYGVIAVEKLNVSNMSASPGPKQDVETGQYLPNGHAAKAGLNKSILDAGWYSFRMILSQKAARARRVFVEVNPAYTSQDCSQCGFRPEKKKKLSDRWHFCPKCGCSLDRDTNAAHNIIQNAMGQHSVAGMPA